MIFFRSLLYFTGGGGENVEREKIRNFIIYK